MKKLVGVLTAVCVLVFSANSLSFAGTGEQGGVWMSDAVRRAEEEQEFLRNAVIRTTSLDSMAVRSTVVLNQEKQAGSVTIRSELKFRNRKNGDLQYQADLLTEKEGTAEHVLLFYSGGYYYMEEDGKKLKVSMDLYKARGDLNYDPNSLGLAGLDSIQNLRICDDGTGNKLCTFLCDDRNGGLNDYFYGIYQQMDLIGADIDIKEMKGSFLINPEGYCTAQTMDIVMDITEEDVTAAAEITIDIEYLNPGRTVDFVLPSTGGYTEA